MPKRTAESAYLTTIANEFTALFDVQLSEFPNASIENTMAIILLAASKKYFTQQMLDRAIKDHPDIPSSKESDTFALASTLLALYFSREKKEKKTFKITLYKAIEITADAHDNQEMKEWLSQHRKPATLKPHDFQQLFQRLKRQLNPNSPPNTPAIIVQLTPDFSAKRRLPHGTKKLTTGKPKPVTTGLRSGQTNGDTLAQENAAQLLLESAFNDPNDKEKIRQYIESAKTYYSSAEHSCFTTSFRENLTVAGQRFQQINEIDSLIHNAQKQFSKGNLLVAQRRLDTALVKIKQYTQTYKQKLETRCRQVIKLTIDIKKYKKSTSNTPCTAKEQHAPSDTKSNVDTPIQMENCGHTEQRVEPKNPSKVQISNPAEKSETDCAIPVVSIRSLFKPYEQYILDYYKFQQDENKKEQPPEIERSTYDIIQDVSAPTDNTTEYTRKGITLRCQFLIFIGDHAYHANVLLDVAMEQTRGIKLYKTTFELETFKHKEWHRLVFKHASHTTHYTVTFELGRPHTTISTIEACKANCTFFKPPTLSSLVDSQSPELEDYCRLFFCPK